MYSSSIPSYSSAIPSVIGGSSFPTFTTSSSALPSIATSTVPSTIAPTVTSLPMGGYGMGQGFTTQVHPGTYVSRSGSLVPETIHAEATSGITNRKVCNKFILIYVIFQTKRYERKAARREKKAQRKLNRAQRNEEAAEKSVAQ